MNGQQHPTLPTELEQLTESGQHLLNRVLGECVPIQEVAHEMGLTEDTVLKTVDRIWLSLSILTRQQFIRFWKSIG